MSAAALLAELEAAGVRLTLAGGDLRYRTRAGISIVPYRERIVTHKPALVAELLKARIIAVVTVDPALFDREEYERLLALREAHEATGADHGR
jgi:hypothetical protein